MDSRIKELRTKYWAGESNPAEERELKAYFQDHPASDQEAQYFSQLGKQKSFKPQRAFSHPGRKIRLAWLSAAAAVAILITAGIFALPEKQEADRFALEDPREALEITRASLLKVSEGLNRGKTYTQELNRINEAKESITY